MMSNLIKAIEQSVDKINFSGVISIQINGVIEFEKAYGYADRSNKIINTIDTRFALASGTKFFTALGIGRLIDAGKLSLSTRLLDCVKPEFPNISRDVTIQHLLTHTSGVYDYFDEEIIEDKDNFELDIPCYKLRGPKDYIPLFRDGKMKFKPGERFSYSNGGYILLGIVSEEISGLSYADFIQKNVFEICDMKESGYFSMDCLPPRTAFGYIDEKDGWKTNIFSLPIIGASDGGAFSTINDIVKLWTSFFEEKILSRNLTRLFLKKAAKVKKDSFFYGHGIWIEQDDEKDPVYYLIGCDAGVSFKSRCFSKDTIATIISNTTNGVWPASAEVEKILKTNGIIS